MATDLPEDPGTLVRALAAAPNGIDLPAAEALADAMATWEPADRAAYRASILSELARRGGQPLDGLLAAEVLALIWTTEPAA